MKCIKEEMRKSKENHVLLLFDNDDNAEARAKKAVVGEMWSSFLASFGMKRVEVALKQAAEMFVPFGTI